MNEDNNKKIKDSLIKLYLKLKLPLKNKENKNSENEEKSENLSKQSILTLIEYISSIYDISLTMKIDEEVKKYINSTNLKDLNNLNDYELLLRKLENDIRHHISIENQIKLYGEKVTIKLEELEKDNVILSNKIEQIMKENKELKLKNKNLIEQIHNLKILKEEYEKKIKNNEKLKNISLFKNKLINKTSLKLSNFHKSQINFFYGKKNNNIDINPKKNIENQYKLNNSNNSFSYKSKIKIMDEENFHNNNNKVIDKILEYKKINNNLEQNKNDIFLKENTRNFICKKTKSVNLKKDKENIISNEKNFNISKILIEKNGNNVNCSFNDLIKNNKLFKNDKNLFVKKLIKEISKNNVNIPFVNNLNNTNNFLIYNGIDIADNSLKKNNLIKKNNNFYSKKMNLNKSSVV